MKKGLLLIAAIIFIAFNSNAQFSDNFQDGDASDWLTVSPNYATNAYSWHLSDYSGDYYFSASCFDGANHATEQWVISPAFSTTGQTGVKITFDNRKRYTPYQDLELYVSTDFAGDSANFTSATWTQITGLTLDSDDSDYDWATTANLSLGVDNQATVYIAFKYVSTDAAGGNWTFNNVQVTAAASVNDIKISTKLFPNPASSELNIQGEVNISNITVSNVIGQRVLNIENINSDFYQLNVENLNNGVYMININNIDGTSAVTKFVKK